jgi:hypothetical protein
MGARTVDEETIRRWISENSPSPDGSSLLSATVELTDAQIKALPATRIQLIAAPGVGKMILPVSAMVILSGGAYSGAAGAAWNILTEDGSYMSSAIRTNVLFVSGGVAMFTFPALYTPDANFTGNVITAWQALKESVDNSALYIKDDLNGVANYTGGNAANTLKVTVYYVVVDL